MAEPHLCERCRRPTRAKIVVLHQNVSYFYARREEMFCGYACLACMTKIFLKYTLTTMLLTWFGIIGTALGPCYIVVNVWEYVSAVLGLAVSSARRAET